MEESLIIAKKLEEAGYDGVVFGTGSYDSIYWLYPPMYMPDGCYIEEASKLAAGMITVLKERIREIRKGETDDLDNY